MLPPPASSLPLAPSVSAAPLLRCQVRPFAEVHSTGLGTPLPAGPGMFSPTAMKPECVRVRPRILSPADMGTPGSACHAWPSAEVQAGLWPSASQLSRPRTISTGTAPGPGGTLLFPSAARAQVRPPSWESRISGTDSGPAPWEPTATMVLPAAASPVSEAGRPGPACLGRRSPRRPAPRPDTGSPARTCAVARRPDGRRRCRRSPRRPGQRPVAAATTRPACPAWPGRACARWRRELLGPRPQWPALAPPWPRSRGPGPAGARGCHGLGRGRAGAGAGPKLTGTRAGFRGRGRLGAGEDDQILVRGGPGRGGLARRCLARRCLAAPVPCPPRALPAGALPRRCLGQRSLGQRSLGQRRLGRRGTVFRRGPSLAGTGPGSRGPGRTQHVSPRPQRSRPPGR